MKYLAPVGRLFAVLLLALTCRFGFSQTDNAGPGHALRLNGPTDYVEIGDHYDDLHLPFTISAWIKVDPGLSEWGPVFASQNDPANYRYEGFWLIVQPNAISVGYGDGHGSNLPDYRRSKTIVFSSPILANTWANVTAVIRGPVDMDIYVNGVDVGGGYSGSSPFPMSARPTSVAKIGNWYSNFVTYRFKGELDEIRLYNRSLSASEIREAMCKKIINTEPGLIGHWMFNEISGTSASDESVNHFDGTLINGPTHVYSGAALGDQSSYLFTSDWNSKSIGLAGTEEGVQVDAVAGNPAGVEVYMVEAEPTLTGGLTTGCFDQPYFGVFLCTTAAADDAYNLNYLILNNSSLPEIAVHARANNSEPEWQSISGQEMDGGYQFYSPGLKHSAEYIDSRGPVVKLPDSLLVCDSLSYALTPSVFGPVTTYQWSTGDTGGSITISKGGRYWVRVEGCSITSDTTDVTWLSTPKPDLGPDIQSCESKLVISPLSPDEGDQYLWSNGSISPSIQVSESQRVWLTMTNVCGQKTDTMKVEFVPKPLVKLMGDSVVCTGSYAEIWNSNPCHDCTYFWSSGQKTDSIRVNSPGKYWLKATNPCGADTDSLSLVQRQPPQVRFDQDTHLCLGDNLLLRPIIDCTGCHYTWNNQSTGDTLFVTAPGNYRISLSNICGNARDSIQVVSFQQTLADSLFYPNVITPTSGNQYFQLDSRLEGKTSLLVFNRWGREVYRSFSYSNNWDGGDLPAGVYYYLLTGTCIGKRKGAITILR